MLKFRMPNKVKGRRAVYELLMGELIRLSKKDTIFTLMVLHKQTRRLSITSRGTFYLIYQYSGGGWWEKQYERIEGGGNK